MSDDDLQKLVDGLTTLGRRRRKLAAELAELARTMPPLVVAAARHGVRPARLRDLSGYSDESVRRILREAGIERSD